MIFIINFWIAISFAFSILFSKGVDVVPKTSLIEQLGHFSDIIEVNYLGNSLATVSPFNGRAKNERSHINTSLQDFSH